jgi:hypothetical protein
MGRTGRALVERDYSWASIVGRWMMELGEPPVSTRRTPSTRTMSSAEKLSSKLR